MTASARAASRSALRIAPVLRLVSILGLTASWIPSACPPLSAQVAVDAAGVVHEEHAADDGAAEAADAGEGDKHDLPAEYRSGAVPGEPLEVENRFRRAEDHFDREEWGAGIALLDEILADVTAPERDERLRRRALRRRRALERAARERARKAAEDGGAPAPGAGPGPDDEAVGDDELNPTVEVYSTDGIVYRPVAEAVRVRLEALPGAARGVYRRTYEAPARQALEAARSLPFPEALRELDRIARRYPLTPSGRAALEEIALRRRDLGEDAGAARALDLRLGLAFETGDTARAEILARAAVAHLLAGHVESGRRRLEELAARHSETPIPIRGEAVLAADFASTEPLPGLLTEALRRSAAPSPWTSALGTSRHSGAAVPEDALPSLGTEAEWFLRLRDETPDGKRYRGSHPTLQLVTLGDRAFLRRRQEIIAVDIRSGKLLWRADPGPPPAPAATGGRTIVVRRASTTPGSEDYLDQGGKALTLWRSGPEDRAVVIVIDHSARVSFSRAGQPQYTRNRLIAYDAVTGKIAWRLGGNERALDGTAGLVFTAPPVECAGLLVAPGTRDAGYYLVGFSVGRRGATTRWVTRLFSFSTTYLQRHGQQMTMGSLVASTDGLACFAPGLGLAGAVDATSGRLLWLGRYRSRIRPGSGLQGGAGARWMHGHPLLARREGRDLLIIAPEDTDIVTGFDALSGETIWERRLDGGSHHVLGADADHLYVAGGRVRALSLATGEVRWETDDLGSAAGLGFLASGRVYLPWSGGRFVSLALEDGSIVEEFRLLDPRVPTTGPFNLFPAGGRLLALASEALISLRGQRESWEIVEARAKDNPLQRVRLLRGANRHEEAIALLRELLVKYPDGHIHEKLLKDLVATSQAATEAAGDPRFLRELLDADPPLVRDAEQRLRLRLRQAELIRDSDPVDAGRIYLSILGRREHEVTSPEGNRVESRSYVSDVLRDLLSRSTEEAVRELRADEAYQREAEAASALLEDDASARVLASIVDRRSHTPAALEASRRLVRRAIEKGEALAARQLLRRLESDAPDDPAIPELRAEVERRFPAPEPAPTQRLLPGASLPDPGGRDGDPMWKEAFWQTADDGILVATAPGSDPLPAVLAMREGKLRVLDPADGSRILEMELPDYPDLESVKSRLQSHIEEPFVADRRGESLVLFTPAGFYGYHLKAREDRPAGVDVKTIRLRWRHEIPHALSSLGSTRSVGWGTIASSGGKNLFPLVFFPPDGDPRLLLPDGHLVRLSRQSGKILERLGDDRFSVLGEPVLEGRHGSLEWRPGATILVASTNPPGLIRYALPDRDAKKRGGMRFLPGPEKATGGRLVSGVAAVYHGARLAVRSTTSGRDLWTRSTSSRLVMATPEAVWTSGSGNLRAKALRSGRLLEEIELPAGTSVASVFDEPRVDGDGLTLVTSVGSGNRIVSRLGSLSQTGRELHLVQLGPDLQKARERRLATGSVTYDGNRHVLADGRWLFVVNVQESEGQKWYTRTIVVSPTGGEPEVWIEAAISGKGTGQPGRLAAVAGGLALGNSEGFGLYRPPSEQRDDTPAGSTETPTATGEGTPRADPSPTSRDGSGPPGATGGR